MRDGQRPREPHLLEVFGLAGTLALPNRPAFSTTFPTVENPHPTSASIGNLEG